MSDDDRQDRFLIGEGDIEILPPEGAEDAKVSKESVHYRYPAPDQTERCARCTMFLQSGMCSHVEGAIDPRATCDDFERKT